MCGIFALYRLKGTASDTNPILKSLIESSKLRGRDGTGYKTFPWGFIGASRARPLPEGRDFTYPHLDGKYSVVFNGTISNADELAQELKLNITVDTEVIVPCIKKFGYVGAAEKLVGGFAILVAERTSLHVIRNFKTLWYLYVGDVFLIASEREFLLPFSGGLFSRDEPRSFPSDKVLHLIGKEQLWSDFVPTIWGGRELDDNKAIIVASAGLDSATAAAIAKKIHHKEVLMLNFDYGQRARVREWQAVQDVAKALGCESEQIELPLAFKSSPLTNVDSELPLGKISVESTLCWVPARNFMMLAVASAIAEERGIKWIYFGNNLEEEATGYKDNDLEFIVRMNAVLEYGTLRGVQVKRALARLMKTEIITLGTYLGVDYSKTWSCDEGFELPCGKCGCCTTRRHAFVEAGIEDKQKYMYPLVDSYFSGTVSKPDINQLLELVRK